MNTTPWYRVFGRRAEEVQPAVVLEGLAWKGRPAEGHFQADEHGWYRCAMILAPEQEPLVVECFRVFEEGVRAEVQSWAAFVETQEGQHVQEFMEHLNAAQQVFAAHPPAWLAADGDSGPLLVRLCTNLATASEGIYQIDGAGFFWANGAIALEEDDE